jgi:hypothetical protein
LVDIWHHREVGTQVLGKRKFNELKEPQYLARIDHRNVKKDVKFIGVRFIEVGDINLK